MTAPKKVRWQKFFSRGQHPVLISDLAWRTLQLQPEVLGLSAMHYYKRDVRSTYFDSGEYQHLLGVLRNQLAPKPHQVLAILKQFERDAASLIRLARSFARYDWPKASDSALRSRLTSFLKRFVPLFTSVYYPLWVEEAGTDLLHGLLKSKPQPERERFFWQATRPDRLTTRDRYRLSILQASQRLTRDKTLNKKRIAGEARSIAKQFDYLASYMLRIERYSVADIEAELRHVAGQNPASQLQARREAEAKQTAAMGQLLQNQSQKVQDVARVLAYDVWLRDERVTWYARIFTFLEPMVKEAARRVGLTYYEFVQQTLDEIASGNTPPKRKLQERLQGYSYLVINDTVKISTFRHTRTAESTKTEVHGQTAFPGRVKGIVRLGNAYIFHQIQPGEVIVSGMTTPEAIAYVKKAAAIVTDEGGITCHAAIVAREFKIPTIIGTKIATKVLKDGDYVEVDANKGIVRKLGR